MISCSEVVIPWNHFQATLVHLVGFALLVFLFCSPQLNMYQIKISCIMSYFTTGEINSKETQHWQSSQKLRCSGVYTHVLMCGIYCTHHGARHLLCTKISICISAHLVILQSYHVANSRLLMFDFTLKEVPTCNILLIPCYICIKCGNKLWEQMSLVLLSHYPQAQQQMWSKPVNKQ